MKNLIILLLTLFFLGCESKKEYDINTDPMLSDLNTRIGEVTTDLNSLTKDVAGVNKLLNKKDVEISFEHLASLKKELLEADVHKKKINEALAYLKIQRKQRFQSLYKRKHLESLVDDAKKESDEYFLQKKLKPMPKPWLNRYRTAIEM